MSYKLEFVVENIFKTRIPQCSISFLLVYRDLSTLYWGFGAWGQLLTGWKDDPLPVPEEQLWVLDYLLVESSVRLQKMNSSANLSKFCTLLQHYFHVPESLRVWKLKLLSTYRRGFKNPVIPHHMDSAEYRLVGTCVLHWIKQLTIEWCGCLVYKCSCSIFSKDFRRHPWVLATANKGNIVIIS